jgi:nucleoside-diphosphate-sugar epimerase
MMRILMTGGSGVLGRASIEPLREAGHLIEAPRRDELDLFDPDAVATTVRGVDAVLHLATRIPPPEAQTQPEAWRDNDLLRRNATGILVDAALAAGSECFVFPSIAFVYPPEGPVNESTPIAEEVLDVARSALDAEEHVARFSSRGGRGVVLRLGLLYGPGTGSDTPSERYSAFGATLWSLDAGRAIVAALRAPAGIYNVVRDGERVSNARFKLATGWSPDV